jgi:NAD(P)-dependent dehydrogenase (short-subunit alcohol dehydrogenase family)
VSSAGIEDVPAEQLERVLRTNVFGYIFMAKAAVRGGGRTGEQGSARSGGSEVVL